MKTEDIILLGRRAKNETEAFINRHFENNTKGWPKVCLCHSASAGQCQKHRYKERKGY